MKKIDLKEAAVWECPECGMQVDDCDKCGDPAMYEDKDDWLCNHSELEHYCACCVEEVEEKKGEGNVTSEDFKVEKGK